MSTYNKLFTIDHEKPSYIITHILNKAQKCEPIQE